MGCVTSALYKHYDNKQQLYEAILEESIKGYEISARLLHVDFTKHPEEREKYIAMTESEQIENIQRLFLHSLHSEWASASRKLMMLEQFHLRELAEMYDKRYVFSQYEQYAALFQILMDAGKLKKADAYDLAVAYISPVIVLIGVCDRDPNKEKWALEQIERQVKEFNRNYRI